MEVLYAFLGMLASGVIMALAFASDLK